MEFILAVLVAIIIGLIPAYIAFSKGRDFYTWWIYGSALFIVAIFHAIILKPTDEQLLKEGMKKCPYCAEIIRPEATVCRYCTRELPANQTVLGSQKPMKTKTYQGTKEKYCGICSKYTYHTLKGYRCSLRNARVEVDQVCDDYQMGERG